MTNYSPAPNDLFAAAVERLRVGLPALEGEGKLRDIQAACDEVYARYGQPNGLFAPHNLSRLTAEGFRSFLLIENNKHWNYIHRQGPKITQDVDRLRAALDGLLNEAHPISQRYDEARNRVKGLGRAVVTPILHVVFPDRYGVWNSKSESGLRALGLFPTLPARTSEGEKYAAVNDVFKRLADMLDIDLWTLDTLWEWLKPARDLAPPFDAIFADRAQAEWAFDLFRDAVERLGGRPDDPRFALTRGPKILRLNVGNSMVLDVADRGQTFRVTALLDEMERAYDFEKPSTFRVTVKGTARQFGVYTIPPDIVREWPADLQTIFEQSMEEFGKEFASWERSNLRSAHEPEIFAALFDEDKRDDLLTNGLSPDETPRYWRITLPSDMREDMSDGRGSYNFWADCLAHGVAAIGFDKQPGDPQSARFAQIRPGDRVVAFLRNKTIGGIGRVTSPLDERVASERPADQDFFRGGMWRRIGVDWQAKEIKVSDLPPNVQHKFGTKTVVALTEEEFEAVKALIGEPSPPSIIAPDGDSIANEFRGFTADAFAFLTDLKRNNNKAWMEQNRERWRQSVLEPMRALFADLGPAVKPKFDPYLLPDELEIRPTVHHVLARIYKNWAATPDSQYYEYYWGAFYRVGQTRLTDAQIYATLRPEGLRCGFNAGRGAESVRDRFRRRVLDNPEAFYALIENLQLQSAFQFIRAHDESNREVVVVRSADDVRGLVESGDYELSVTLTPEVVVRRGPALVDDVLAAFRRAFPVYLWAVAENHLAAVERYLEAEFPGQDEDDELIEPKPALYGFDDFHRETYLTEADADELLDMLRAKRQLVFYGPPGTGKTYVARRLGQLLTDLAAPPAERLTVVQFHPAYGYEEFIEGIRPRRVDGGTAVDYPVLPGAFVRFCREAARVDGPCVFIIDEINRGSIPRIFGELMLLLEYRDLDVTLPYSGERFRIPPNVYLIGTMNTADRSIALVDFALRRRFHFFRFDADPDLFDRWLADHRNGLPWLGKLYRRLTAEAIDDPAFRIGPSAFMEPGMDATQLARVWRRSIMPYLEEYYIDQPAKANQWRWDGDLLRALRGEQADA